MIPSDPVRILRLRTPAPLCSDSATTAPPTRASTSAHATTSAIPPPRPVTASTVPAVRAATPGTPRKPSDWMCASTYHDDPAYHQQREPKCGHNMMVRPSGRIVRPFQANEWRSGPSGLGRSSSASAPSTASPGSMPPSQEGRRRWRCGGLSEASSRTKLEGRSCASIEGPVRSAASAAQLPLASAVPMPTAARPLGQRSSQAARESEAAAGPVSLNRAARGCAHDQRSKRIEVLAPRVVEAVVVSPKKSTDNRGDGRGAIGEWPLCQHRRELHDARAQMGRRMASRAQLDRLIGGIGSHLDHRPSCFRPVPRGLHAR